MREIVFDRIIKAAGSQAELARALDIKPQSVIKWRGRGVPPDRVLEIERLTGVSRHEIRPDVFGDQPDAAA